MQYSIPQSPPLTLTIGNERKVYGLFALAMFLTMIGVLLGRVFAPLFFTSGIHIVFLIVELLIVFTARFWMEKSPWNILFFGLFPLLSGITIAPYLWYVSTNTVNGNAILLNALAATVFMAGAAALFGRTTSMNLGVMGRALLFALLGLIGFGLLQLFVPALRQSTGFEMALSGIGILVFAAFTAYDIQRIQQMSAAGTNAFLLALSLYLDIFNLFLYVLRFMTAVSGRRQ